MPADRSHSPPTINHSQAWREIRQLSYGGHRTERGPAGDREQLAQLLCRSPSCSTAPGIPLQRLRVPRERWTALLSCQSEVERLRMVHMLPQQLAEQMFAFACGKTLNDVLDEPLSVFNANLSLVDLLRADPSRPLRYLLDPSQEEALSALIQLQPVSHHWASRDEEDGPGVPCRLGTMRMCSNLRCCRSPGGLHYLYPHACSDGWRILLRAISHQPIASCSLWKPWIASSLT